MDKDEYYEDAVNIALEKGGCSASLLQRRLAIGYNRATMLIDSLEEAGIIEPYQQARMRKALMTREEYDHQ